MSLDGELSAIGTEFDGKPWYVALEKPDYDQRDALSVIALNDASIATSGDYRHWVDVGEQKLSHSMNPMQKGPVQNNVASVSVIAKNGMLADAWATALLVLAVKKGKSLANKHGLDALYLIRNGVKLEQVACGDIFTR